jgi:hypothetical protein
MSHRFDCPGSLRRLTGLFCFVVILALAQRSEAQSVQANQADLARAQSETAGLNAYPGAIAPSPNDSDLGEQQILAGQSQGHRRILPPERGGGNARPPSTQL